MFGRKRQALILDYLRAIHAQNGQIIMGLDDTKQLIAQMNTATNAVAARIQALIDRLANSPSDADLKEINDGLTAEVNRLNGLGADPAQPIPPDQTSPA